MAKLRLIALIFVLALALALPLAATVTFSPAQPGIGQTVTFILNPAQPNLDRSHMINWSFGDGTSLQTTILVLTASHAYTTYGSFQVSVTYYVNTPAAGSQEITEQTTVQVLAPNRILSFSPAQPNVGEAVTFQAKNFLTPTTIDWNFGDGVTINDGGAVQTHIFNTAGTFLVQARDQGGSTAPTTASVPVTNRRQIQFSPASPKTGQAVQFQAIQFTTACIKWSFGDGTIQAQGAAAASHVFAKPGVFQVTAQDNCGNSPWLVVTTVSVTPSQGPLAGFDVSYGVLRFADGKTSKLVPRNTTGLAAFADLKFEGTGPIQVEWRVDGQPFRTDSQVLTFAQPITLGSGTLPGLPTATPGTHTVELRFLQPHTTFTLSPITYTVVVGRAADAGPIVETVTPGELERGKEYELQLHGRNLTPGTSFAFGPGVGVVRPPQFQGGTEATLKVFISPSAKPGDRPVTAANPAGTRQGPGQITVSQAVQPKAAAQMPLVCPDLSTIPLPSRIDLKSPLFWFLPMPGTPQQQGDVVTPAPPVGEKSLKLLTVDDGVTLVWDLPFAYYDYVEIRFFRPAGQKLLLKRQLPGTPESLRLSGDLLAELFEALKPSSEPSAQTGIALSGQAGAMELADLNLFGGGDKAEPTYDSLYADGLKAGADVAWQVAAFRVYPCLRDNKTPGGKTYTNQPVEEAVSDLWLFNLPAAFTGLTCGGTGSQKAGNSVQAVNKTAGERDQKAGPNAPTSNANFVGDLIELKGSFSLKGSPYASHVAAGNTVKIENLFIDWGDGSSAVPVIGKLEGGGSWSKEKKITLTGGLWQSHRYQTEGTHTVRIFQLSEDDIQAPKTDFYAALGEAVTPPQPGNDPYLILLEAGQGQTPGGQEAEPNPLSGALPRAYMIYCSNILINHYADKCATGPVHLVSLEILNFPGHDIVLPGKGSSQDGVMIRQDLAASYTGIHAVAVQCDEALIARARLRYFGAGSVEITWLVDGIPVQNKTYTLASKERSNIAPGGKPGCTDAEVDAFVFTSQPFSVAVKGKHNVRVRAEFTPQYGLVNLAGSVNQAAASLLAIQAETYAPPKKKDGPGPAAEEADTAVGGQGYDPFAAMLALEEKAGLTVPQIGLLSPNPESNGKPVIVYLNDALKGYDAPSSPSGPWANDSALGPGNRLTSDAKGYIVNEVRDVKFCRILVPTSGGEFRISDLGSSIQLQNETYSGQGAFHYQIRTGADTVEKAYATGTAFSGWTIEESTGRLLKGLLDAAPTNGGTLMLPASLQGFLRRLQGQVDGQALKPLMAIFDLELKGVHGTFLASATGNAGQPPAWKSAAGALNTEGDWIASGLALGHSAIGLTGFQIESPAVTIDFSRQASPPNASGEAAGPDWVGVYLDQAVITPATFGFAGTQAPAMTNLEPWRIKDGGLYGSVRSGSFSAKVDQATVSFNHLDFKVAADKPEGKYILCAIHVPWIEAVLMGDAVLQLISDAEGYGTNWSGLTANPVTVQYADKGRVTMTVDGLVWGRDSRGWRARGHAFVATEAEGKPFAAFHLNGLNFGTDGRAYFDGPTWDSHVGLSGDAVFGGATAALKGVQIQAAASGQDRLAFGIETEISISPDSSYIPASAVVINYRIYDAGGGAFAGQGPWNAPFSSQVVFPLGSQEIDSAIAPSYAYDPNAADPEEVGLAGTSGPSSWAGLAGKAGKNMRFGGAIDLAMFGCESVKGAFVLGYQDGKSFFLLFAKYDNLVLPLSPVPLAIFGIGGGFAYNFSPEVFRHNGLAEAFPDMLGAASFCAVLTLGTTDRYTIMSDGYMILGTDGSAEMGFKNAQLMQTGNFGGYIKYKNKSVTSKVWGELDLLGGLVNFSLGTEAAPAIDAYFGPGGWYVYAGRKAGPRIKATIMKLGGVDSYLELDSKGLRMGGSQKFRLDVGPSLLKGYIESWMDISLVINIKPFFMEGSWVQGVAAGGCFLGICDDFSVSATITAHAPNPTFMRASTSLDFGPLGTATLTVRLAL